MTSGPLRQRLTIQAEAVARCADLRAGKTMVDAAMDRAVTIVTLEKGFEQRRGWVRHQCNQAALKAAKKECGSLIGLLAWMAFQTIAWAIIKRWIDQLLEPAGQETRSVG